MANENGNGRSFSMSSSVKELTVALIAVQTELPKLAKDKTNSFYKNEYAGLETVLPAALNVLTAHGFGLVQTVGADERGGTTLTTILLHDSGEWLSDTQPLLLAKEDPQGQGSAITYGRRYAVMSMLGLVADADDDANAATPRGKAPAKPKAVERPDMGEVAAATPKSGGPTDSQIKMMQAILTDLYGRDDRAKVGALTEAGFPEAIEGTNYHLAKLTSAGCSAFITWLKKEQAARDGGAPEAPAQPKKAAEPAPVAPGQHAEQALDAASEN